MNRLLLGLLSCLLLATGSLGLVAQELVGRDRPNAPAEQYPVFQPDGKLLYFSRLDYADNKGTDNAADIWTRIRYADGSWGRAINPGSPVNSFAHDRALSVSPDGNRLAVLRSGAVSFVELLETAGRSWRIAASWPVPEDAYPRYDLTFDANAQELTYSAYDNGQLDLFRRRALADGRWSEREPLTVLNGPQDEFSPILAADGRTLYFRRAGGRWYRQSLAGERPQAVALPVEATSFAARPGSGQIVLGKMIDGRQRLQTLAADPADLPVPTRLVRGQLRSTLPVGESVASVSLGFNRSLSVRPDAVNRYAVFLRADESINDSPATAATGSHTVLAGTAAPYGAQSGDDRQLLEDGIAQRQAALARLDAERRTYELVAPRSDDPELTALRSRYQQVTGQDTLPPATDNDSRYARDLEELRLMKEKFLRQQEDRLQQRSGATSTSTSPNRQQQTAKGATSPHRSATATRQQASRRNNQAQNYPVSPGRSSPTYYEDSIRIADRVGASLRRDVSPRVYERETWENEVRTGLPRQEPLSPEEAARLDAEYQQQLSELETLRARLRRLEEPTTPSRTAAEPDRSRWQSRSPYATDSSPRSELAPSPAPSTYAAPAPTPRYPVATPATTAPRRSSAAKGAPMPAGIDFIANTAYPDSRGYQGLDQLVGLLRQAAGTFEVRVHTAADLRPRVAQLLSEERATTIRNYLLGENIPAQVFRVVGFGNHLTGKEGERVEVVRN